MSIKDCEAFNIAAVAFHQSSNPKDADATYMHLCHIVDSYIAGAIAANRGMDSTPSQKQSASQNIDYWPSFRQVDGYHQV